MGSCVEQALVTEDDKDVDLTLPSSVEFKPEGPFFSPSTLDVMERVCRSRCRNDLEAAILSAQVAAALNVVEVLSDINSSFSLLALGQPWYGLAMLTSVLLPNLYDPFQTKFAGALAESTLQGMTTKEILKHQEREGLMEGNVSCVIALCALIRTPDLSVFTFGSLLFTVVTSLLIGIPTGSKARLLLKAGVKTQDYYELSKAKKRLKASQKYFTSALVMPLGCALGLALVALHEATVLVLGVQALLQAVLVSLALVPFVAFASGQSEGGAPFFAACLSLFWLPYWIAAGLVPTNRLAPDDQWHLRRLVFSVLGSLSCVAAWVLWCLGAGLVECRLRGLKALNPSNPRSLDEWTTFGCPELARASGKFYYEMEFLSEFNNPQVGFLRTSAKPEEFGSKNGVGDTEEGWALNGQRQVFWHNGEHEPLEMDMPWEKGDVIGVAVDLDGGEMQWRSHGGSVTKAFQCQGEMQLGQTFVTFSLLHARSNCKIELSACASSSQNCAMKFLHQS